MSGCEHVYNEDSNDFKFTLKLWLGHVPEHYLIAECSFWKKYSRNNNKVQTKLSVFEQISFHCKD